MNSVAVLNVHGIGDPVRPLEPDEGDVWISLRQFELVLDAVAERDDVRLTFDDGNLSDIEIALPLLTERNLSADFFICPGLFGMPGRLTADGIRELCKAGMTVSTHGWGHIDWRLSGPAQVVQELQESRTTLRQITGAEVEHVSVPFGSYDRYVLRELQHFGLSRAYTSDGGRTDPDAWLQPRTSLRSDVDQDWLDRVLDPDPPLRLRARNRVARAVKSARGRRQYGRQESIADTPPPESAAPAQPRLGIVIVTFNSAEVLRDCLASLAAGAAGVDLADVVVVDNASIDDSMQVAASFDDDVVRTVEFGVNAGYAAGVNAGIRAMQLDDLDAVLVLNPDCRLRPGSLGALAAALQHQERGIVVPKLLNPDGTLQPSLRHQPTISRSLAESALGSAAAKLGVGELVGDPAAYTQAGAWAWATGAAMLLSTQMIRSVGAWDESFLLYSEETEYALRAGDCGWQLWFEPAAVIEHVGGVGHMRPMLAALLAANRVRLYRLRHGLAASSAFYLAEVVGTASRAAMGRPQSHAALAVLLHPSRRVRELPSAA